MSYFSFTSHSKINLEPKMCSRRHHHTLLGNLKPLHQRKNPRGCVEHEITHIKEEKSIAGQIFRNNIRIVQLLRHLQLLQQEDGNSSQAVKDVLNHIATLQTKDVSLTNSLKVTQKSREFAVNIMAEWTNFEGFVCQPVRVPFGK